VEDAHGAAPSIPFWNGEAPGRTTELSQEVSSLREAIASRGRSEAIEFLQRECSLDLRGAEQGVRVCDRRGSGWAPCPLTRPSSLSASSMRAAACNWCCMHPLAPPSTEPGPGSAQTFLPFVQLRAAGRGHRQRHCHFTRRAASFPLEVVFSFLNSATVEDVLRQALLAAPMFTARWRWNATRFARDTAVPGRRQDSGSHPAHALRTICWLPVFPDQAACGENLTGEIRIPDHPLVTRPSPTACMRPWTWTD